MIHSGYVSVRREDIFFGSKNIRRSCAMLCCVVLFYICEHEQHNAAQHSTAQHRTKQQITVKCKSLFISLDYESGITPQNNAWSVWWLCGKPHHHTPSSRGLSMAPPLHIGSFSHSPVSCGLPLASLIISHWPKAQPTRKKTLILCVFILFH